MNYLRQIWYEMRKQPVITWVTIGGTALSIFLVMVFYMVSQIDTVGVAPESNRSRIGNNAWLDMTQDGGSCSGPMSYESARKLSENIPGVERVSYYNSWSQTHDVNMTGGETHSLVGKGVDANFWKIFDFEFVEGAPFTENEVRAGMKKVILTDETAYRLAGKASIAGKKIMVGHIPYIVSGVVRQPSPLLSQTFSEMFIPVNLEDNNDWNPAFGDVCAYLLLKEGTDMQSVKKEVERRYDVWNEQLRKEGKEVIYHGNPFTYEDMASEQGSNNDPSVEEDRRRALIVYSILLLLPAINLSSMTRSRLRQRVSEIGVRRAFGATRRNIIGQLLGENLVMTFIGGVIGLVLSVGFMLVFSSLFVNYLGKFTDVTGDSLYSMPDFSMLFTWRMFGFIVLVCFLLNLLSSGIPAWKASGDKPAEAIKG